MPHTFAHGYTLPLLKTSKLSFFPACIVSRIPTELRQIYHTLKLNCFEYTGAKERKWTRWIPLFKWTVLWENSRIKLFVPRVYKAGPHRGGKLGHSTILRTSELLNKRCSENWRKIQIMQKWDWARPITIEVGCLTFSFAE